ncbi:hypothetical protein D3C71_1789280 [compost metagenome]
MQVRPGAPEKLKTSLAFPINQIEPIRFNPLVNVYVAPSANSKAPEIVSAALKAAASFGPPFAPNISGRSGPVKSRFQRRPVASTMIVPPLSAEETSEGST